MEYLISIATIIGSIASAYIVAMRIKGVTQVKIETLEKNIVNLTSALDRRVHENDFKNLIKSIAENSQRNKDEHFAMGQTQHSIFTELKATNKTLQSMQIDMAKLAREDS